MRRSAEPMLWLPPCPSRSQISSSFSVVSASRKGSAAPVTCRQMSIISPSDGVHIGAPKANCSLRCGTQGGELAGVADVIVMSVRQQYGLDRAGAHGGGDSTGVVRGINDVHGPLIANNPD